MHLTVCHCPDCGVRYRVPNGDCTARCFCGAGSPKSYDDCKHLGEVLDSSDKPVILSNCGCASANMPIAVFECNVHGECLPTYRRGDLSESIKTCLGCEQYEPK